jgi:hypothetical protein
MLRNRGACHFRGADTAAFHEHEDHRKFFYDHFVIKGTEAAAACAATIDKIARLKSLSPAL